MKHMGYIRAASSNVILKVADPSFNILDIKNKIDEAVINKVDVIAFPELCITGYSCNDLFLLDVLLVSSNKAVNEICDYTKGKDIAVIVGLPVKITDKLYNMALVINDGKYLGAIAKTYIPNENETYEKRWFASGKNLNVKSFVFNNQIVPCGNDLLFKSGKLIFGVEIGDALEHIKPLSSAMVVNGANVIFNIAASNETADKHEYRQALVKMQSVKGMCGYVYVSANANESSGDLLFSGANMIYENGNLLKEGERFSFEGEMIWADIDLDFLTHERIVNSNFAVDDKNEVRIIEFAMKDKNQILSRKYPKYPFIPFDNNLKKKKCKEILTIQSMALARRMKHINTFKTVIGLSGGLDSTLALLVIVKANEILKIDNSNIIAVTMPGFGTSDKTYDNALKLAEIFNVTLRDISIKKAIKQHFKDIEHDIDVHDLTYENAQARERTQILMDIANKEKGIVVGTGDLSELVLGWCTYNGDQMSMYGVNSSVVKTMIKDLINYFKEENKACKEVLESILDTPVSPELLPPDKQGNITQKTEDKIGPYKLHDFFIYHLLRCGSMPSKIFVIARNTFKDEYSPEEILQWLTVFVKRFISQQFKRSSMPDGVKVDCISLSPRGDWRMPSDASYQVFLDDLNKIKL